MWKFIEDLVSVIDVRLYCWRHRNNPITDEEFAASLDAAFAKFPNDRICREGRALADMAMREFRGIRRFDA